MRNHLKKSGLFLAVVFYLSTGEAQQLPPQSLPVPMSIAQIWQKAETYSKSLHIKQLQVDEAMQGVSDAKASRLPDFSADANIEKASDLPIYTEGLFNDVVEHNVVHTRYKMGADGYLNIYNGNKVNLKVREQQTLKQIAEEQQRQGVSDLRLHAAAYYLELQKGYTFQSLIVDDIADQEKQLAKIRYYFKQGVILKSDVLRAELKLSHEKLSLTTISNDIAIACQNLNILMGEPDAQLIRPATEISPDSITLKSYDDYLTDASGKSYDKHIAEKNISLNAIRYSSVKANTSLKFGLYGSFAYANPETFLYPYYLHPYTLGIAGFKASFPISAFYLNKHKEKAAAIEVERAKVQESDIEDKVRVQVNTAYLRFKEAMQKVEEARINVSQAIENQRIVSNTYFNQTALVTDLLDANVQVLQSRFDLTTAQTAAMLQFYQLQNVTGNL